MQLIVISGLSGSGKSIALNVLEDSGYYCVDNLPAHLLASLTQSLAKEGYERVAVSIDVRSGGSLSELPGILAQLRKDGVEVHIGFLDAKTDTLVKRYSETRRRHPLADERRTLTESIEHERELLADLAALGHHVDTSDLSPNTLRQWVKDLLELGGAGLTLLFQSFGFKHGIPLDADMVFDVRCLPNPHYDPVLRPMTGRDAPVVDFLRADANVQGMLGDIREYVDKWLPCFVRDNRSYLTVAIGCTGGRHRSVYFVEQLAAHFRGGGNRVLVRHRELSA
ncbi:MAG TPA: RNase adapter RapZ [Burkholderiales bacterium]|nr:RNase adapter RapZ [Burkholderiales bacterium]